MPETTIADLLTLLTREPGRPRITWYGDDGERVELSGAVLENWVNKTANLLVEEFDAGPGTRVLLDLPGHWRTVVWALAVWRVGACVVLPDDAADHVPSDVVVTDRPGAHHDRGHQVVAVALPALARSFDGERPAGSLDAAGAVMTYADVLQWAPAVQPDEPGLDDGTVVPHASLRDEALLASGTTGRALRTARPRGDRRALLEPLGDLATDGSSVLASPATSEALRADDARRQRLVDSERITADLVS
ncbi:TIGR03089 family protein [Cellulomonas chitinilytica]|uniref:TIGR03089 family protein n=1 Tax=Cellulomonas chitinilytica TaxID=398759 RepID=UPI001940F1DE|nr:TIGR03089 family protein [Cellulomonas chitinilytica]